ncbi:hypothetical protein KUV50_02085 [Membranicola marinus]|uniref:Uncharacterized protein n=1 Tax=Membranihabitans marinus TaxID=1227546 RepID=A0A953L9R0_9BACT|nr:hypothetical protein [Membranihabitans marinus]MBY5956906.1 hypothetical protein [Membranihabitans marinus]
MSPKTVGALPYRGFFILSIQLLIGFNHLLAQEIKGDTIPNTVLSAQVNAPFVYIDCQDCDHNFIRTELSFVHYVRDPEMADIHVFVTTQETAGGGREYQFSFIGRRAFAGTDYTLKHYVGQNATESENRNAIIGFLNMGYASFILQTPLGARFSIEYKRDGRDSVVPEINDPWNYWVFQAYVGSVQLEMESNQTKFNSRWGLYADRVTEDWKFRLRPYFNYGLVNIQAEDRDDPVVSIQRRHGFDSYAIKSLNDHWSAGLFGTYLTNNGQNLHHNIVISPGIEYSLFPYKVATRKAITFTYQLGYGYHDYYEETIYGKIKENLFDHQFKGVVNILQPWGNIETGFSGSQYLHDLSRFRVELYGQTSVRVFEGFSLGFQTEYSVVRDQLGLPKGEASLEDVLLNNANWPQIFFSEALLPLLTPLAQSIPIL